MSTKDEKAITTLYANLMDEVKVRLDWIDKAVHGHTQMPGPLVRELCYLQLRMLCELIALSCLVVHGDIPAAFAKRLSKESSADKIMDEMTKLKPHFYPQPIRSEPHLINGVPGRMLHFVEPAPFTKGDLLRLYGMSHAYLHRGNEKKLLTSETPIELHTNFPQIIEWGQRIADHLSIHAINLNPDRGILCVLRTREENYRVTVSVIATKPIGG